MNTPSGDDARPSIHLVELFGVPRLLAGASVRAAGSTLGEVAADLLRVAPTLAGPVLDPDGGWPLRGYAFVVDERFSGDPGRRLEAGTSVLLVSSVAGG